MKIENVEVYGFNASLRGMRNPKDSWDKSDSYLLSNHKHFKDNYEDNIEGFVLGEEDKKLAQTLTKAGSEHYKFLRSIQVWFELDAPRYMWSEFDTYKFHTSNSCSTMHTIHKRKLTQDDFEEPINSEWLDRLNYVIGERTENRIDSDTFIHTIKNSLPEGFLQKRSINTNYAELLNQYQQRKNHRLQCWREYCKFIESLPYFKQLIGLEG